MAKPLLDKTSRIVTMDIVWGHKIKQVGTHPARAQGGDPGLTDDSEYVTDDDDITVKSSMTEKLLVQANLGKSCL